jgi:hypothetical protein
MATRRRGSLAEGERLWVECMSLASRFLGVLTAPFIAGIIGAGIWGVEAHGDGGGLLLSLLFAVLLRFALVWFVLGSKRVQLVCTCAM